MAPTPTDLIDWLNDEGLLELDWDFPENGDLFSAGMDPAIVVDLAAALEDKYGIELSPDEFKGQKLSSPIKLAKLIESRVG